MQPMWHVDLHLHSRYSDRPSEWILRKLGVPQSCSAPEKLYQQLHDAGMRFKTITDHNRIDGVLSIAHHPDVFLSEEVTTYFPDGCKIHLLVWNISPRQHDRIQELRQNIFDLSGYLRSENIPHAVTHGLTPINGKLTIQHIEQLILLFKMFETRNGNREPLAQQVLCACLQALTPKHIEEFANRHNLQPTHANPERKICTAGSDDHGGLYVGNTYTTVTQGPIVTVNDFFAVLSQGNSILEGPTGDPLKVSSAFYNIVLSYAQERLSKTAPLGSNLLQKMADRFLAGKNPTAFSFGEKLGHLAQSVRTGSALDFIKPGETSLSREIAEFITASKTQSELESIIKSEPSTERRSFRMASYLTNELGYRLTLQFIRRAEKGNVLDALQSLTGILPAAGAVLPYLMSFSQCAPDRLLLQQASHHFTGDLPKELTNHKRAWFTDTLEDVNGVARTICSMTRAAKEAGHELVIVTSRSEITIQGLPIINFKPVGEFELPEYKLQKLSFPPLLEIIDYIQREGFTELIISTPGPIGLCALAAGKLLGLRMSGIYHTDFPQYARILSDDALMESLTWSYMQWFYGQFETIYANSEYYRLCWIDRGISPSKLKILPRGLDTELFNPKHRDATYWIDRGARGPVFLYVGRISKEKELGFLASVIAALQKRNFKGTFAFVGDGPFVDEMKTLLPDAIFTGILTGRELGIAYASADVFLFPSTTDTFGNVVIEAQSAGLPVLVSDVGGPKELIRTEAQGRVIPAKDEAAWINACESMLNHIPSKEQRESLGKVLHTERSWDRAFTEFWKISL